MDTSQPDVEDCLTLIGNGVRQPLYEIFEVVQLFPDFTPDIWTNLDCLPEALLHTIVVYQYKTGHQIVCPTSVLNSIFHDLIHAQYPWKLLHWILFV